MISAAYKCICTCCGYFVSCIKLQQQNMSNEENVHPYYMLNHRIRDLLSIIMSFSNIV